jgi:hypothetical protein
MARLIRFRLSLNLSIKGSGLSGERWNQFSRTNLIKSSSPNHAWKTLRGDIGEEAKCPIVTQSAYGLRVPLYRHPGLELVIRSHQSF